MNRRIAHIDADAVLNSPRAQTGLARQIYQSAILRHQPQISAARRVRRVRLLISKNGDDG